MKERGGECSYYTAFQLKRSGAIPIDYANMLDQLGKEELLRYLIKKHLKWGCTPYGYSLQLTVKTRALEEQLPPQVRRDNPDTISIVFQYRYTDLVLRNGNVSANVKFSARTVPLIIPLDEVVGYGDPEQDFYVWLDPV